MGKKTVAKNGPNSSGQSARRSSPRLNSALSVRRSARTRVGVALKNISFATIDASDSVSKMTKAKMGNAEKKGGTTSVSESNSKRKAEDDLSEVGETSESKKKKKKKKRQRKNPVVRLVNRCVSKDLVEVFEKLKPKQIEAVNEVGFGGLLKLKVRKKPKGMLKWMIQQFDMKNRKFHVGEKKEFSVGPDDAFNMFGVPKNEGHKVPVRGQGGTVSKEDSDVHLKSKWRDRFGITDPKKAIPVAKLKNTLLNDSSLVDGNDDFKRIFVMFIMSSCLGATSNRFADLKLVAALEDVSLIATYDWCTYIWDTMCSSIARFKDKKEEGQFLGGCSLFHQLVYFQKAECRGKIAPRQLPLIQYWTDKTVQERIADEFIAGFGSGAVLNHLYPVSVVAGNAPQCSDASASQQNQLNLGHGTPNLDCTSSAVDVSNSETHVSFPLKQGYMSDKQILEMPITNVERIQFKMKRDISVALDYHVQNISSVTKLKQPAVVYASSSSNAATILTNPIDSNNVQSAVSSGNFSEQSFVSDGGLAYLNRLLKAATQIHGILDDIPSFDSFLTGRLSNNQEADCNFNTTVLQQHGNDDATSSRGTGNDTSVMTNRTQLHNADIDCDNRREGKDLDRGGPAREQNAIDKGAVVWENIVKAATAFNYNAGDKSGSEGNNFHAVTMSQQKAAEERGSDSSNSQKTKSVLEYNAEEGNAEEKDGLEQSNPDENGFQQNPADKFGSEMCNLHDAMNALEENTGGNIGTDGVERGSVDNSSTGPEQNVGNEIGLETANLNDAASRSEENCSGDIRSDALEGGNFDNSSTGSEENAGNDIGTETVNFDHARTALEENTGDNSGSDGLEGGNVDNRSSLSAHNAGNDIHSETDDLDDPETGSEENSSDDSGLEGENGDNSITGSQHSAGETAGSETDNHDYAITGSEENNSCEIALGGENADKRMTETQQNDGDTGGSAVSNVDKATTALEQNFGGSAEGYTCDGGKTSIRLLHEAVNKDTHVTQNVASEQENVDKTIIASDKTADCPQQNAAENNTVATENIRSKDKKVTAIPKYFDIDCSLSLGDESAPVIYWSTFFKAHRRDMTSLPKLAKDVADYALTIHEELNLEEIIVSHDLSVKTKRADFCTFLEADNVTDSFVNSWSLVMNEFSLRKKASPARYFFGIDHMVLFKSALSGNHGSELTAKLFDVWNTWSSYNRHIYDIKTAQLIFMPMEIDNHYSLIVINMIRYKVEFIDVKIYNEEEERSKVYELIGFARQYMAMYLLQQKHPMAGFKMDFAIVEMDLNWKQKRFNTESGFFMLVHMMFYQGYRISEKFSMIGSRRLFRAVIASKLILSDINEKRSAVLQSVEKYALLKASVEGKKKKKC